MNFKDIRLIFAMMGGILGLVIAGIAEEALWTAGDLAVKTVSNCENLKSGWDAICTQNQIYYYIGKNLIKIIGFIAPFFLILGIFRKRNK